MDHLELDGGQSAEPFLAPAAVVGPFDPGLYAHDARVAPWAGTAHGVLQAVNTFEHHEGTIRGTTRPERNMLRTINGEFAALDRASWDTLSRVLAA